eukprot:gene19977-biopygen6431
MNSCHEEGFRDRNRVRIEAADPARSHLACLPRQAEDPLRKRSVCLYAQIYWSPISRFYFLPNARCSRTPPIPHLERSLPVCFPNIMPIPREATLPTPRCPFPFVFLTSCRSRAKPPFPHLYVPSHLFSGYADPNGAGSASSIRLDSGREHPPRENEFEIHQKLDTIIVESISP